MAEETEAPKGGNKKLILGLVVFNVLAAGGVGYVFMSGKDEAAAAPVAADAGVPAAAITPKALFGPMVELKPLVGNLDDPSAGRYVKVTVHLEIASEELRVPIEEAMVPIRNAMIVYFTGVKVEETVGAANRKKIAKDLLEQIQKVIGKSVVKRVFFAEFVTQ